MQEEEKRIKDEKDNVLKRRKELIKEFTSICIELMPGTKFDKYNINLYSIQFIIIDTFVKNLQRNLRKMKRFKKLLIKCNK